MSGAHAITGTPPTRQGLRRPRGTRTVAVVVLLAVVASLATALSQPATADASAITVDGPGDATGATVSENDAAFTFSTVEPTVATLWCALDAAAFEQCATGLSGTKSYDNLPASTHTFTVQGRDASDALVAGQSTAYEWTISAPPAPPAPTIDDGPGTASGDTIAVSDATFVYSSTDPEVATFECSLDDAEFAVCAAADTATYNGLSEDYHTFQVRTVDQAGDTSDPAFYDFNVDLPGLDVDKYADDGPVQVGDTVGFQIYVSNNEIVDHHDVVVSDVVADQPLAIVEDSIWAYSSGESSDPDCALTPAGDLECTLAVVESGDYAYISFNALVTDVPADGIVENTATVSSSPGPDAASDEVATSVIPAVAVLELVKHADDSTVVVGESVRYRLEVGNGGFAASGSAAVHDALPVDGTIVPGSVTISPNPGDARSCTVAAAALDCALGAIEPGELVTIGYRVTYSAADAGASEHVNNATLTEDAVERASASAPVTVLEAPTAPVNLVVGKWGSSQWYYGEVVPGEVVTYTVSAYNGGDTVASGVTLVDDIPANAHIVPGSLSSGAEDCIIETDGDLVCELGTLTFGASAYFSYQVVVDSVGAGSLENAVTMDADQPDVDGAYPTATSHFATEAQTADLSIYKQANESQVAIGETTGYQVYGYSNGPSNAVNVVVTDVLPAGFTYVDGSASGSGAECTYTAATRELACNIPFVGEYGSYYFGYSATAPSAVPDPAVVTNTATVASPGDPNSDDNSASANIEVVAPAADVSASKYVYDYDVQVGSNATFELQAYNDGPSSATNVTLTDELSSSFKFVSALPLYGATGSCTHTGADLDGNGGTVTCTAPSLARYNNVTFRLRAQVVASGDIPNEVSVAAANPSDPYEGNNTDSATITGFTDELDIDLSYKDDSWSTVPQGESGTYWIPVANSGPADADQGVTLTDVLPAGVTYVSAHAYYSRGFTCSYDDPSRTVTCTDPYMYDEEYDYILIEVEYTGLGAAPNTITATTPSNDIDLTNNSATDNDTVVVAPEADLRVNYKTDYTTSAVVDDTLYYEIQVQNLTGQRAMHATVTDVLPEGVTFQYAYSYDYYSYWTCDYADATRTVTCDTPSMPAGAYTYFQIAVTADAVGTLSNTASVTSDTPDPDTTNNSKTDANTTVVAATADLRLQYKNDGRTSLAMGENTAYEMYVYNAGPRAAHDVVVSDPLPVGVDFVEGHSYYGGWSCSFDDPTRTVQCSPGGGTLYSGYGNWLYITVESTVAGAILNTATITSSTADPNLGNNSASDNDTVVTPANFDLTVDKFDNDYYLGATPGEQRAFTVYVRNSGPTTAPDVTLTDTLPAGMTFVSGSTNRGATCTEPTPGTVTCPMGDVGTYYYGWYATINVALTAPGDLVNTASAASALPGESNTANNSDAFTLHVDSLSADLAVTQLANEYLDYYDDPAVVGSDIYYYLYVYNYGPGPADVQVVDQLPAGVTYVSGSAVSLAGGSCAYDPGRREVTCSAPDVADYPYSWRGYFRIRVTPTAVTPAEAPLVNSATISSTDGTPDGDSSNNGPVTEETPVVANTADVAITPYYQSRNPAPVNEQFYYQWQVTNGGPATATGIVLHATLDESLAITSNPWGCSRVGTAVTCNVGTLERGQSTHPYFYVTPSEVEVVTTSATVTTSSVDPNAADNGPASFETTIDANTVDLAMLKQGPSFGVANHPFDYYLYVANHGPGMSNDTVITDTLPAGLTYVSSYTSDDNQPCGVSGQTLTCNIGTVPFNNYYGYYFARVTVTPSNALGNTTVHNTASVVSSKPFVASPQYSPTDTEDTPIRADEVDLEAYKSTSRSPGVVGEPQTFYLQLYNRGPASARNARLTDTVPAAFDITGFGSMSHTGACQIAADNARKVDCNFGDIASGSAGWVYVNVTPNAASPAGSPFQNTVSVSSDTSEITPGLYANSATIDAPVVDKKVDIEAMNSRNRNPMIVGESSDYFTIQARNHGPAIAEHVTLTDTIPSAFTIDSISNEAQCDVAGQLVTCDFGNVGAGSAPYTHVFVTPTVHSPTGSPFLNKVEVFSDSIEVSPDPTPNAKTISVTVIDPRVNLEADKSVAPSPPVVGEVAEFTLSAYNHGPAIASAVTLTDTFNSEIINLSIKSQSNPGACALTGQTVNCSFGDRDVGDQGWVVVRGTHTVAHPFPGDGITNTVTVDSPTPEIAGGPARGKVLTYYVYADEVNLQANKTTDVHGTVGQAQTYTLQAYNAYFGTATNVRITDTIPAPFTIPADTNPSPAVDTRYSTSPSGGHCTFAGNAVTCTFASLAYGSFANVYLNVLPTAAMNDIVNTMSVTSDEGDAGNERSPADNTDSFTSKVSYPPTVDLTFSPSTGQVGETFTANINASDPDGDSLGYYLQWGDGAYQYGAYPPASAPTHIYSGRGPWSVYVTVTDGGTTVDRSKPLTVNPNQPVNADAGDDFTTTANARRGITFDASRSTPSCCINEYRWTLSDGRVYHGRTINDVRFNAPGTYTATLRIGSGPDQDIDTATIEVGDEVLEGVEVTVREDDGNPSTATGAVLSGAQALIVDSDNNRYDDVTVADGIAVLTGVPDDEHTVYVLKTGYTPNEGQVTVEGGLGEVTVELKQGEIAVASLTAERITDYATLIAAGIDPEDPDNNNVYEFEINLAFEVDAPPIPFNGFVSEGGGFVGDGTGFGEGGGGGSCYASTCGYDLGNGYVLDVDVVYVQNVPTIVYMVIPGKAKWLKEFWNVSFTVTNLGSPSFVLEDGVAQLQLPVAADGSSPLGLPALFGAPQSAVMEMPDIAGGQSEKVSWIVRGDTEGTWDLSATYAGTLQPVGVPVTLNAVTSKPLKVWGLSAVRLEVVADDHAYNRTPYDVIVRLRNVTDSDPTEETPLFNVGLELFKKGTQHFIYQPGQDLDVQVDKLMPGEFLELHAVLIPDFSGTLHTELSFVRKKASGELDETATITSQPAEPLPRPVLTGATTNVGDNGGVTLDWVPIPGAQSYEVWATDDQHTHFTGTPRATTDAATTEATVLNVPDGVDMEFAVVPLFLVGGKLVRDMQHPMIPLHTGAGAGSNTPPTATNGVLTVSHSDANGDSVTLTGADADANPITFELVGDNGGAAHGTVALSGTQGEIATYIADHNYTGTDSFDFRSFDGGAYSAAPATISVTVTNQAPTAVADLIETVDSTQSAGLSLVANDSDPDDDTITFQSAGNGTSGTVSCTTAGVCKYTPAIPGPYEDDFSYTIVDEFGEPATGSVHVSIHAKPHIDITDTSVVEGNPGDAHKLDFTLALSTPSPGIVKVKYGTSNRTAKTADHDYVSTKGTLTFNPGTTELHVLVPVTGDDRGETNETMRLKLTIPVNATTDAFATGTILNDDPTGAAPVAVTDSLLTYPSPKKNTVSPLANDTDPEGDHLTLAFESNGTNGTVTCTTTTFKCTYKPVAGFNGDGDEATVDDTFTYRVSDPLGNYSIGTVEVRIIPLPHFAVTNVTLFEGAAGTEAFADFTVTLVGTIIPGFPVSTSFKTVDKTAKLANHDYEAYVDGPFTFDDATRERHVFVKVFGDGTVEPDEYFKLTLTGTQNASVPTDVRGNIRNDD